LLGALVDEAHAQTFRLAALGSQVELQRLAQDFTLGVLRLLDHLIDLGIQFVRQRYVEFHSHRLNL
jgi:hypothetical protein